MKTVILSFVLSMLFCLNAYSCPKHASKIVGEVGGPQSQLVQEALEKLKKQNAKQEASDRDAKLEKSKKKNNG